MDRPTLHVEILQKHISNGKINCKTLISDVDGFLRHEGSLAASIYSNAELPPHLLDRVNEIRICELNSASDIKCVDWNDVELEYHTYFMQGDGPVVEEMGGAEGEDIPLASHWMLPSSDFHNLWDTLIYDADIKEQIKALIAILFLGIEFCCFMGHLEQEYRQTVHDYRNNPSILSHFMNTGTFGKTSLCKALAQKLSIRVGHRFKYGQLFEVNSHSLFSRWFSESGKLVQKLFSKIAELTEDSESLVFILIDEVESLTRARASTASGSDPSDALRVVNALLTQLDQIKSYQNVLILTTSNVTGMIDLAFVDRADIKQYIGLPSPAAIYQILQSCLVELMKKGIISENEHQMFTLRQLKIAKMRENSVNGPSLMLWKVAESSEGLSGRVLRKIPFLAHALHLHKSSSPISLTEFVQAMAKAVHKHRLDSQGFA